MDNRNGNGNLDIPDILKRSNPPMSNVDTETVATPKPKKARKAPSKAADASKAPAKAKAAPKAAKAASKAVKAKPAKKAKAKREPVARDKYGCKVGSVRSKALAMYASKDGATLDEVKDAVGSIQLNVLIAQEKAGHKVKRVKEKGTRNKQVTRYFLK